MQTRFYKEARLLWPAALLTLAAILWPVVMGHAESNQALVFLALLIGCAGVAACSFGPEFTSGTIALLLAQPLARTRLWNDKMLVLGLALGTIGLSGMIAYYPHLARHQMWLFLVVPIAAFCTVPCMTFITRNTIGAIALSLAGPFVICLGGGALILWLFKTGTVTVPGGEVVNEEKLHRWLYGYFGTAVTLYTATLYFLGYHWFQRLQVANAFDRQLKFAHAFYGPVENILGRLFPRHGLSWLLRKELRLQQNAVMLLLILTLFQAATLFLVLRLPPEKAADGSMYFAFPLLLHALLMPLTIGACAIAEEEKLGVRSWHLTLPLSAFSQWLLKLFVAVGLTLILGVGVLLGWSRLGSHLWPSSIEFHDLTKPAFIGIACALELFGMAVAFYASSVVRDALRAFLAAAALFFGVALTATSSEPFLVSVRKVGGEMIWQIAEKADLTWAFMRPFGNYIAPTLLVLAGLPFLVSSFLSYRTIDRSFRRFCVGAVTAFLLGIVILLCMLALSGAKEMAQSGRFIFEANVKMYEGLPPLTRSPHHRY